MSHSPGPWKAVPTRFYYGSEGVDGIEDAEGNSVLRIDEEVMSETICTKYIDVSDDDMALILAAPALLKACKTAMKVFFHNNFRSQFPEAVQELSAAIAKATVTPAAPADR